MTDFAAAGFARPPLAASNKSRPADLAAPINLALRMRAILGVSVRAEAMRILLTVGAPRITAQALARSTGFSKRNVHDALSGLTAAGVASTVTVAGAQQYAANRDAWASLLRCDARDLPEHRDWPQLLGALRRILRWLSNAELDALSDYMRDRRTRDLLEALDPEMSFAGIAQAVPYGPGGGWDGLLATVESILDAIGIFGVLKPERFQPTSHSD